MPDVNHIDVQDSNTGAAFGNLAPRGSSFCRKSSQVVFVKAGEAKTLIPTRGQSLPPESCYPFLACLV